MIRRYYYRHGGWHRWRWWHRFWPPDFFDDSYGERMSQRFHCPVADCEHGERE